MKKYTNEVHQLIGGISQDINVQSFITDKLADLQECGSKVEKQIKTINEEIKVKNDSHLDVHELSTALSLFDPVWDSLSIREQGRILNLMIERVGYDGKNEVVEITYRPTGIKSLAKDAGNLS